MGFNLAFEVLIERMDTFTSLAVHVAVAEFTASKMTARPNGGLSN